eukprot:gnl/MRDRNA2_/MRDRNA2_81979_c0_seq2.p1 gnl/MRDRNA2_/MRDRNA2_81979_c0~~gnl/MRDRNA2_/MRDRNA2_81979_c0_seq2.p1  ORF type:complete len:876 (-),score=157.57 gnl/MRDRNA2_/MRDRNA2_81979_c0_seq2:24-2651(-)
MSSPHLRAQIWGTRSMQTQVVQHGSGGMKLKSEDDKVSEINMVTPAQFTEVTLTVARIERHMEEVMRRVQKTEEDFAWLLSDSRLSDVVGSARQREEGNAVQHSDLEVRVLQRFRELRSSIQEDLEKEENARKAEVAAVRACLTQGSEDFALIQAQLDEERARRMADSEELRGTTTLCAELQSLLQQYGSLSGSFGGCSAENAGGNSTSLDRELRREMEILRKEWRIAIDEERKEILQFGARITSVEAKLAIEIEERQSDSSQQNQKVTESMRALAEAESVLAQVGQVKGLTEKACTDLDTRFLALEAQLARETVERQQAIQGQEEQFSESIRALAKVDAAVKGLTEKVAGTYYQASGNDDLVARITTPRSSGMRQEIEHVKQEVKSWQTQLCEMKIVQCTQLQAVSDSLESKLKVLFGEVEQKLELALQMEQKLDRAPEETSPPVSLGGICPAFAPMVVYPDVDSKVVGPSVTPSFPAGESPLGGTTNPSSEVTMQKIEVLDPTTVPTFVTVGKLDGTMGLAQVQPVHGPAWSPPLPTRSPSMSHGEPSPRVTPRQSTEVYLTRTPPQSGMDDVEIRTGPEDMDELTALREENMRLREENLDMREERVWNQRHPLPPPFPGQTLKVTQEHSGEQDLQLASNAGIKTSQTFEHLGHSKVETATSAPVTLTTSGLVASPNVAVRSLSANTLGFQHAVVETFPRVPSGVGRQESMPIETSDTYVRGPSPIRQQTDSSASYGSLSVTPAQPYAVRSPQTQLRLVSSPQMQSQPHTLSPTQSCRPAMSPVQGTRTLSPQGRQPITTPSAQFRAPSPSQQSGVAPPLSTVQSAGLLSPKGLPNSRPGAIVGKSQPQVPQAQAQLSRQHPSAPSQHVVWRR